MDCPRPEVHGKSFPNVKVLEYLSLRFNCHGNELGESDKKVHVGTDRAVGQQANHHPTLRRDTLVEPAFKPQGDVPCKVRPSIFLNFAASMYAISGHQYSILSTQYRPWPISARPLGEILSTIHPRAQVHILSRKTCSRGDRNPEQAQQTGSRSLSILRFGSVSLPRAQGVTT